MISMWLATAAVWIAGAEAAANADAAPSPDGRALHTVIDPAFEGNGPGGGFFANGRRLGAVTSSMDATGVVAWTVRPLRVAIVLPTEIGADRIVGLPPRIDGRFVLADRRRGGLGVGAAIDLPFPFVTGGDRSTNARLTLGVGKKETVVAVNLGATLGVPLEAFTWAVGGALPLTGPLGAFAEIEGVAPVALQLPRPSLGAPAWMGARVGLHLAPVRPLVLTVAVAGSPASPFPTLSVGAVWIPKPKPRRPRTDGPDRDNDRVADSVDACPEQREDFDGGNDADGCPDGGARTPSTPDATW
ncbi:MAG: hypothetical protein Q8P18_10425 [Pseudomonadota bacterium]|nr:hypothetical protein [Pseudomonadota bacterium]